MIELTRRVLAVLAVAATVATASAQPAGTGRIVFPTSQRGPAQDAFIRGILNLHNFEYDEAIIAFREAQTIAPSFAMAYWGEALACTQPLWYNEDISRARAVLARLGPTASSRAAKAPTLREQGYMAAIETLFGEGDRATRFRAFADSLSAIARRFPEDDEARAFESLALLGTIPEGTRRPDVSLKAGALASLVLQHNPQHPGAAHYVLHAYDDGEHNAMALPAARIYARLAPQSSHAQHMPSHAFLPLGMWDEAAASDEASWAASVAWVTRTGRTVNQQDFHSLSWLHYEYLQQGRFAKARETAAIVARALDETLKPGSAAAPGAVPGHGGMTSEIGRGWDAAGLRNELANMRARSVIEGNDWHLMKGRSNFDNVDELGVLGLSAVANEEYSRAEASVAELRKASSTLPDRDAADVASIVADEIAGTLSIAAGKQSEGLATLARAASREAARPKPIARPYPPKPAEELYAEALLGLGQPSLAMTEFRKVLQRLPRRPATILGLARAASAAGNRAEAQRAAGEFLQIWHLADTDRPELAEARALVRK